MPIGGNKKDLYIGVIGAGQCNPEIEFLAEQVGSAIAKEGAILVCGGLGGVMKAAAKGAKSAGGRTLGILPGDDKNKANEYIDIAVATGIGEARNIVIIKTADAVVALPGRYGTLSEMAFCMKIGRPLVSLSDWDISEEIERFTDPEKAVKRAVQLAGE